MNPLVGLGLVLCGLALAAYGLLWLAGWVFGRGPDSPAVVDLDAERAVYDDRDGEYW